MDLEQLIQHPEMMDKETLYDLRSVIALHPYFQTARLLMLQNLYILHDPSFDEELRKAAIYLTDRKVIFKLVEAAHYKLKTTATTAETKRSEPAEDRTISLIDNFLGSIPSTDDEPQKKKRKPTPADAAIDYVSYLLETESEEDAAADDAPQMKGQELIDNFINNDNGKIELKDKPEFVPETPQEAEDAVTGATNSYCTETLARIYIQQGRFERALEIIKQLNLIFPKKNVYFADQIRFLEKLILNSQAADTQT